MARLEAMSFEEGMLAHVPVSVATHRDENGPTVRWSFGRVRNGSAASSCTMALEPVGRERTATRLACAADHPVTDPTTAARAASLIELVVDEHAIATLSGRPFDRSRMGRRLIGFAAADAVSRTR
jgi:hypothetical protein